MSLSIVILAAGQGKRIKSSIPKMLHKIADKTLLEHIVTTAQSLEPEAIYVVYGHQGERVKATLDLLAVNWVEQTQQLGTAHAVQQALPQINPEHKVLMLCGDVPLVSKESLQYLMQETAEQGLSVLTAVFPQPHGLGRILRDHAGNMQGIIEEKEASSQQKKIQEINTGILYTTAAKLNHWLEQVKNENATQEYYLTDIIALAVADETPVKGVVAKDRQEVQGINDRIQLAQQERFYQQRAAQQLMLSGVSLKDPARFDLRGTAEVGQDTVIDVNVVLEGSVRIGKNCQIGPNVYLKEVNIADNVIIKANSVIEQAEIANECIIGPFARIRPGTKLAEKVHIGNFVEIKQSQVSVGSKINHLSYVGDTTVGKQVNIGAGTITCNYDGANKHRTIIEDGVFIGSDTQLIAPVTVGAGATIGAGSTIAKDAPANALTVSRAQSRTIHEWQRPQKDKSN